MDNNILTLRKFSEEMAFPDLNAVRLSARKYGALVVVGGGLEYIDVNRFNTGVDLEVKAKAEQAARRAQSKESSGRKVGLLKARTERAPSLIAAKSGAIAAAREQVEQAENPYERSRAKKALATLEAGLQRLKDNFDKDQAELSRILNEPEA